MSEPKLEKEHAEQLRKWAEELSTGADNYELTGEVSVTLLQIAAAISATLEREAEGVGYAPYIVDEDIPDLRGGMLFGPGMTLTAYYSEEDAKREWPRYPIAKLILAPKEGAE